MRSHVAKMAAAPSLTEAMLPRSKRTSPTSSRPDRAAMVGQGRLTAARGRAP